MREDVQSSYQTGMGRALPVPAAEFARKMYARAQAALAKALPRDERGYRERLAGRPFQARTAAAVLAVVTLLSIVAGNYTLAYEVRLNGETVGYAANGSAVEAAAENVESYVGRLLGRTFSLDSKLELVPAVVSRSAQNNEDTLNRALLSGVQEVRLLYRAELDGTVIAAAESREAIEAATDRIIAENTNEKADIRASFAGNLELSRADTDAALLVDADALYDYLTEVQTPALYYTVGEGDTIESVAVKFAVEPAALRAMNALGEADELTPGTKIMRRAAKTRLPVKLTQTMTEETEIPYAEVTVKDDTRYDDYTAIESEGQNGVAAVTADVSVVDGKVVSRTELSRTVLTEPVDRVVVQGTQEKPDWAATGILKNPFPGGLVTSRYGWRSRYEFHEGLDLGGSYGSSLYAADGGQVSFAGWRGNYGKLVIIDHGNGTQTWYAHLSAYAVKAGDYVAQGDVIARVGNTGRSTGPHLHFEVHMNGETVNPEKVLSDY